MVASSQDSPRMGWYLSAGEVGFERSLAWQRQLVKMRRGGLARDTLIFVQHPPVLTVGRDGHELNFRGSKLTPFFIERGGDVTYHGPGQLVVYFVFNLTRRGKDLHKFMRDIQQGIIDTLADYDVVGRLSDDNTGVWVGDHKIASIGIAVKHWISFHGAAINLNTDLGEFKQIHPCGLEPDVMTSLETIKGELVSMSDFESNLLAKYSKAFNTVFTPIALADIAEDIESQEGGNVI